MPILSPLSRRPVGPCRCGSRPGPQDAAPASDRGVPAARSTVWARVRRVADRIENCWIGDLIGVASLFVLLWSGLFLGEVLR